MHPTILYVLFTLTILMVAYTLLTKGRFNALAEKNGKDKKDASLVEFIEDWRRKNKNLKHRRRQLDWAERRLVEYPHLCRNFTKKRAFNFLARMLGDDDLHDDAIGIFEKCLSNGFRSKALHLLGKFDRDLPGQLLRKQAALASRGLRNAA
jgi:hypothetical protein